MNLTVIKKRVVPIAIVIAVFLFLIIVIVFQQALKSYKPKAIQETPPSLKSEPVVGGHFDPNAQISQRSKSALDSLKPFLPYRTQITTSTNQKVTFVVFLKPNDNFTLFVETAGINFQSGASDPNLAKNVQDFRDTANTIFGLLKQHNISPGDVFVYWGFGPSYIQQNAEAWLVPSDKFPNVIKKDNQFIFEKLPK